MTTESNKQLVRRYYEEVVNTGNVEYIANFISPDYVEIYEQRRYSMGIEGAVTHVLGVREVFPDLQLTIDQQIAEGEWVVSCATARGTQERDWLGMKASGQTMEMVSINLDRVHNDRIVEHGGLANLFQPLLKAGAIHITNPAKGSEG